MDYMFDVFGFGADCALNDQTSLHVCSPVLLFYVTSVYVLKADGCPHLYNLENWKIYSNIYNNKKKSDISVHFQSIDPIKNITNAVCDKVYSIEVLTIWNCPRNLRE